METYIDQSKVQTCIEDFKAKQKEIESNPYKLRRTVAGFPYYLTLKKILDNCNNNEFQFIKNQMVNGL